MLRTNSIASDGRTAEVAVSDCVRMGPVRDRGFAIPFRVDQTRVVIDGVEFPVVELERFTIRMLIRFPERSNSGSHSGSAGRFPEGLMMQPESTIYIAGHLGLVGGSIWRELGRQGYRRLIGRSRAELDLLDPHSADDFDAIPVGA